VKHSGFEPRSRARRRALQALYQWQMTGQTAAEIIRQFLEVQNMQGVDVEWFETLVNGVTNHHAELDEALGHYLDRSLDQLDEMEKAVLRIGAFELLKRPEQPYRVVLDECIDLAHRFGSTQGHAYVNAVLDKAGPEWRPHEAGAD
jgi:N utilization substance protein B